MSTTNIKIFIEFKDNNVALIPEVFLLECFKMNRSSLDIYVGFENLEHSLVIPSLLYMYNLLRLYGSRLQVLFIPVQTNGTSSKLEAKQVTLKPFEVVREEKVIYGGTFDHLHSGHRLLITTACLICTKHMIVGLVVNTDKKLFARYSEPFHVRAGKITELIYKINPGIILQIEPLYDAVGPAGTIPDANVLVVSEETLSGANIVQEARKRNGLKPTKVVTIPVIMLDDKNKYSSTEVRRSISHEDNRLGLM